MHAMSVVDGGPVSSHFGLYQQTTAESGDGSIWTLVMAVISVAPWYHEQYICQ